MRLTDRDIRLVRDLVLSHAMCRDQVIELGYFGSVTRANTRLRELRESGLAKAIDTPFLGQAVYTAGPKSQKVVGERLAGLAASRSGTPRFLRHAISVTNVRIAMLAKGSVAWRFEQQARAKFLHGGRDWEVRPDGIAVRRDGIVAVEVDLGHVDPAKFREKLLSYDAFAASGGCRNHWGSETFSLVVVTTGPLRAARLARQLPDNCGFAFACKPADQIGVRIPGAWS